MQKVVFFFLSLTHFFITATYRRFSTSTAQTRNQYARTKTCFSFKIKDRIILFELADVFNAKYQDGMTTNHTKIRSVDAGTK